jgi:hypothetical protein
VSAVFKGGHYRSASAASTGIVGSASVGVVAKSLAL